jgi:uncharacterized NAD(P)/FAD-binding protein YdhS
MTSGGTATSATRRQISHGITLLKGTGTVTAVSRSGPSACRAPPARPDGAQNKCQAGTITAHQLLRSVTETLPLAMRAIFSDCDNVSFLTVF